MKKSPETEIKAMTLKQTFKNIKSDYVKMSQWMKLGGVGGFLYMFFSPSIVAITLYRLSRFFYLKKIRSLAWFLYELNIYMTGADISPRSDIADHFYIGHPVGVVIVGKIGSHVMVLGQAAIGGGFWQEDVGGGPGLPVIEDNVIIGFRATILGPFVIGKNAVIGPSALVMKSIPEGATAIGNPARIFKGEEAAALQILSKEGIAL